MLLVLAGSSCSRKTTVAGVNADLPGLVVHDFDEVGVPDGVDLLWRQWTLEEWI